MMNYEDIFEFNKHYITRRSDYSTRRYLLENQSQLDNILLYQKNNEDSQDAIQDVFLKVAKNFDSISSRLKNENEWRNYLYMSVKNKSFDIIRKKNHQKDIIESLKVDFSNKNDEDFIALLESNNNIETIIQAIQSLGITYKLVLYQNLVMGLKPSEIAKIEGLKLSNVNQKLLRGKAMLRKNLERGVKNDKN